MKRLLSIGGVILAAVTVSCSDYLNVESPSKFENDYVFSKEDEIFNAIAGIYSPLCMDQTYSQAMACTYTPNTDVEFKSGTTPASTAGNSFASYESMSNSSMLNLTWNALYTAIDRANTCVRGIENSELFLEGTQTTPTNVTHMYGEAKTLRAWLYLDMVRLWGDVPFTLTESNSEENFVVGATDRNEILTYLIEDLISVEPMMKYSSDLSSGVERANREFCQGLIARMALHRGGWTLRPDKSDPSAVGYMDRAEDWRDYYKIAEEYAWKVIDEGVHDLKMTFRDLWVEECNWNAPSGDDIVFDLPLLKSMASEFAYSIGIPMSSGGINEHGLATGSNLFLAGTYFISFDPQDLRRDATCAIYSYDNQLNQVIAAPYYNTRVYCAKWCKIYMRNPMGPNTTKSTGVNNTIMRFADVLLMYAEAANENHGGPTPEAIEAVKRVRRRAFPADQWAEKVDAYVESRSSKEDFFDMIVQERAWEFGGGNVTAGMTWPVGICTAKRCIICT